MAPETCRRKLEDERPDGRSLAETRHHRCRGSVRTTCPRWLICPPCHPHRRGRRARQGQRRHRRAGLPRGGLGRAYRRRLGRDAEGRGRHLRDPRPFRAPRRSRRDRRRSSRAKTQAAWDAGFRPSSAAARARAARGRTRRWTWSAGSSTGSIPEGVDGREPRRRLRADLGDRYRPGRRAAADRRGARLHARRAAATASATRPARPFPCSTAAA